MASNGLDGGVAGERSFAELMETPVAARGSVDLNGCRSIRIEASPSCFL
jgi:hypothetical protein